VGKFLLEVLNKIIEFMADIALLMAASIKELLELICLMEKEIFFGQMELNIQVNGEKEYKKEKEYKLN
jgi:hypothetical protein